MSEVSVATRHVMQANRSKDTGPERAVRAALREAGLPGYRLQWKKAPGTPDVCYPGRKVAIFVNGCYWHRCPRCARPLPHTNVAFWEAKFSRNRERDRRVHEQLARLGWTVVVVWGCQLERDRFAQTMRVVAEEVRLATTEAHRGGCLLEPGIAHGWRLGVARRHLCGRR